eukprot:g41775.t1
MQKKGKGNGRRKTWKRFLSSQTTGLSQVVSSTKMGWSRFMSGPLIGLIIFFALYSMDEPEHESESYCSPTSFSQLMKVSSAFFMISTALLVCLWSQTSQWRSMMVGYVFASVLFFFLQVLRIPSTLLSFPSKLVVYLVAYFAFCSLVWRQRLVTPRIKTIFSPSKNLVIPHLKAKESPITPLSPDGLPTTSSMESLKNPCTPEANLTGHAGLVSWLRTELRDMRRQYNRLLRQHETHLGRQSEELTQVARQLLQRKQADDLDFSIDLESGERRMHSPESPLSFLGSACEPADNSDAQEKVAVLMILLQRSAQQLDNLRKKFLGTGSRYGEVQSHLEQEVNRQLTASSPASSNIHEGKMPVTLEEEASSQVLTVPTTAFHVDDINIHDDTKHAFSMADSKSHVHLATLPADSSIQIALDDPDQAMVSAESLNKWIKKETEGLSRQCSGNSIDSLESLVGRQHGSDQEEESDSSEGLCPAQETPLEKARKSAGERAKQTDLDEDSSEALAEANGLQAYADKEYQLVDIPTETQACLNQKSSEVLLDANAHIFASKLAETQPHSDEEESQEVHRFEKAAAMLAETVPQASREEDSCRD